ncbi:hypothetical protein ASPZODRAFT_136372 [Penicilliopsis zonata CBS 506.65]|uniref:Uncharacterized protein n=1 Tax=Penicilliopsis zonata CBS 506.65 TaxID=1073090 RepID=A0A1L9S7P1_9EURO|nr:hypothetical protein ASPZODRAFT_136372 [Penicilliopsis zonata CBS 506.65]OJJ43187.1 hypothetical protein ASPZODRAFT_136372 [Penicilliopsis zonata CBS 506.65]
MMGYASYRATITGLSSPSSRVRELTRTAQGVYLAQLVLNNAWMPLFFGVKKPLLALVDMLVLSGAVGWLLTTYQEIDSTAYALMVPYGLWLGYATYLNAGVGYLNSWRI